MELRRLDGKKVSTSNADAGYIYFLKDSNGYVKIGRSNDPKTRFLSYKKKTLRVVHMVFSENYIQTEKLFHRFYKQKQVETQLVNGEREWFRLSKEDISKIKKNDIPYDIRQSILGEYSIDFSSQNQDYHWAENDEENEVALRIEYDRTQEMLYITIPAESEAFFSTKAKRLNEIIVCGAKPTENEEKVIGTFFRLFKDEKITEGIIMRIEKILEFCTTFERDNGYDKNFMEYFLNKAQSMPSMNQSLL
jgi:hypothetical protein